MADGGGRHALVQVMITTGLCSVGCVRCPRLRTELGLAFFVRIGDTIKLRAGFALTSGAYRLQDDDGD